jgi:hypothetical protein
MVAASMVVASACGRVAFDLAGDARAGDALAGDAVASDAAAVPLGEFGPPQLLFAMPPSAVAIDDPTLTGDLLELYFDYSFASTSDIAVVTRTAVTAAWSAPTTVTALSHPTEFDTNPEITADGLTMRVSLRQESPPRTYESTRATRGDPWSPLAANGVPGHGFTTDATGTIGVFHRNFAGAQGNELMLVRRASTADAWGPATLIAELNTPAGDGNAFLDPTGRVLFFESDRGGDGNLYVASRDDVDDPFGMPEPLAELNTPGYEGDPWLTPDLRTIVFASDRGGPVEFYIATR